MNVKNTFKDLLKQINNENTNLEYPFAIRTDKKGFYAESRMFDGTLISFDTKNGLELNQKQLMNGNFFKFEDINVNNMTKEKV